ncbi:toprim domain-containing protein [Chryseobacterium piperi]
MRGNYFCFDNDDAGKKAVKKYAEELRVTKYQR